MLVDKGRLIAIVSSCVTFARRFLILPDKIDIRIEKCGENKRFKSMSNSCETEFVLSSAGMSDVVIYFNENWVADRLEKDPYDVEYFVFHELRHLDQRIQIILSDRHEQVKENSETIKVWRHNFDHYIRNEGGESETLNVRQPVELDAYIYANVLLNLFHMDAGELYPTIPIQIHDVIIPGTQKYMSEKREIQEFLKKEGLSPGAQISAQSSGENKPIVKGKKIGANDPCPCGSGKKFKKCCRGNGRFDR